MTKGRTLKSFDLPTPVVGGSGTLELSPSAAPPARPAIPVGPRDLTLLGVGVLQSAVTPKAYIDLRWRPPAGIEPDRYDVQLAKLADFSDASTFPSTRPLFRAEGATNTTYYIRVAAVIQQIVSPWSNVVTAATPNDSTPPAAPGSPAAAFLADGSLRVTWTKSVSRNFRAVEVRIFNSASKTVEYEVVTEADGTTYLWPAARNRQQSVGGPDSSPDASVYVELRSLSWGGIYSAAVSATATKARPANVTGVTVDFAGQDALFAWTAVSGAERYRITITGTGGAKVYESTTNRFVYAFDRNRSDHTAADPSLSYSIVAIDALDQTSAAAATGSATNAAPAATGISVLAGFSTLAVALTPPAIPDLKRLRVRLYKNGALVDTLFTTQTLLVWSATGDGSGSYTADATTYDVFEQPSPVTTSAAVTLDVLTLAQLRAGAAYSDSIGTSVATLKAQLADGNRASGGIAYASGTNWKWTQISRELTDRYEPMLITATGGQGYVGISSDGATWAFYAGPLGSDGVSLTPVASEAAAQAAPVALPTSAAGRWDLPALVEGRYVRLYHRNSAAAYTLREWYAERVVEGDLIRAGTVRTLHLAAGAVVADTIAAGAVTAAKISVTQLSAIAADMGTIVAGTITGATIRTAASGQRVELTSANGLRGINSAGVTQVQISAATGALTAAAGRVSLDSDGISLAQQTVLGYDTAIAWRNGLAVRSYLTSFADDISLQALYGGITLAAGTASLTPVSLGLIDTTATVVINATAVALQPTGFSGTTCHLRVDGGITTGIATPIDGAVVTSGPTNGHYWHDRSGSGASWALYASGGKAFIYSATAGNIVQVATTGEVGIGLAPTTGVALRVGATGSDTSTSTYGLVVQNAAGTLNNLWVRDDGAGFLRAGAWTYSDLFAKTNFARLAYGLDEICQLSTWRYDYKRGMTDQLGLIAQQVRRVIPELVTELPDGMGLGLNYSGLIPILINAVKELAARVATLENGAVTAAG